MEKLVINIPTGYEIDEFKPSTGEVFFKLKKTKYPTNINGVPLAKSSYYISNNWQVETNSYGNVRTPATFANLARKEYAEALVALAQLITLRDEYNRIDDFIPDFSPANGNIKWCITRLMHSSKLFNIAEFLTTFHVFAFKTRETGELFINNFAELLKKAKSLI